MFSATCFVTHSPPRVAKARWSFDDVGVPSFEVPKKRVSGGKKWVDFFRDENCEKKKRDEIQHGKPCRKFSGGIFLEV